LKQLHKELHSNTEKNRALAECNNLLIDKYPIDLKKVATAVNTNEPNPDLSI